MKTYLSKDQMLYAENEEEAIVYVGLKIMYDKMLTKDKNEVEISFNLKQLYYQLSGSYDLSKHDKLKFKTGLNGLIDAEVIKLIDNDKEEYTINAVDLKINPEEESYTTMSREEIRTVFNLANGRQYGLLRFAVGLFSTINSYTKCGWCSFKSMPDYTNIPQRTCQKYFALLEENNIIYVHHSKDSKRDENGQIKNLPNVYGRVHDKYYIDEFYNTKALKEGCDFTKKMDSSKRGVVTRRYKKYVNNRFKGDIIELVKDVIAYNEQPYQQQHPETQKDMSVFDNDLIEKAKEEMSEHWKEIKKESKQREE